MRRDYETMRPRLAAHIRNLSVLVGLGLLTALAAAACSADTPDSEDSALSERPVVSCSGIAGKEVPPDKNYYTTSYGCWTDSNGTNHGDVDDNCIGWCVDHGGIDGCANFPGKECERQLKWFAAGKDRYGCNTHLQVTAVANGRSVIVQVIDQGPACFVEKKANVNHAVMDLSYPTTKYLFGEETAAQEHRTVHVEVVGSDIPLGPTDGSDTSGGSSGGGDSCSVNGVTGTCMDTASCNGTSTPGYCPGGSNIQCCTGGGTSSGGGGCGDGWTCDPTWCGDGVYCDDNCGSPDPDCSGGTSSGGGESCSVNGVSGTCMDTASCGGTSTPGYCPGGSNIQCCTYGSGNDAPNGWTCDPSWYGDSYCDCDCGVPDPADCGVDECSSSSTGGGGGWTCDPSWYGDGEYCDCDCGVDDPDCSAGQC